MVVHRWVPMVVHYLDLNSGYLRVVSSDVEQSKEIRLWGPSPIRNIGLKNIE